MTGREQVRSAGGRISYGTKIVRRATEMYEAGWTITRITELLAREFGLARPPRYSTVRSWVDEEYAQERRVRCREAQRRTNSVGYHLGRRNTTATWRDGRVRYLAAHGIGEWQIARVMTADFPLAPPWTHEDVRAVLASEPPGVTRITYAEARSQVQLCVADNGPVTGVWVANELGISVRTVLKHLGVLAAEGAVVRTGSGGGTRWSAA